MVLASIRCRNYCLSIVPKLADDIMDYADAARAERGLFPLVPTHVSFDCSAMPCRCFAQVIAQVGEGGLGSATQRGGSETRQASWDASMQDAIIADFLDRVEDKSPIDVEGEASW